MSTFIFNPGVYDLFPAMPADTRKLINPRPSTLKDIYAGFDESPYDAKTLWLGNAPITNRQLIDSTNGTWSMSTKYTRNAYTNIYTPVSATNFKPATVTWIDTLPRFAKTYHNGNYGFGYYFYQYGHSGTYQLTANVEFSAPSTFTQISFLSYQEDGSTCDPSDYTRYVSRTVTKAQCPTVIGNYYVISGSYPGSESTVIYKTVGDKYRLYVVSYNYIGAFISDIYIDY